MKITLFAWKVVEAHAFGSLGPGISFSSLPMDRDNRRKVVEVNNVKELDIEFEKFIEELKATGLPFNVNQSQTEKRGNRAFSGYKSYRRNEYINVDEMVKAAREKVAAKEAASGS